MRPLDYAAALGVMMIWGVNFPMGKLGVTELPPLLFLTLRFVLVAALLCPFFPLPREKLGPVLRLALVLGSLHFSAMFTGLSLMDAATASLLVQSQVPFAALLAAIFFRDRLGWRRFLGLTVAFAGVLVIVGEPRFSGDLLPPALILAASFFWSFANILIKRLGPIDGFALSGWLALFAAPQLLALSLLIEHGQGAALRAAGWGGWGGVIYAGIAVTVVSYGLWYPLVRRYAVNQTMPFTLLVPVFGVASSAAILGDAVSWQTVIGGAATILGVAIIVLRRFSTKVK
ncbi:MAG TPA: EamA family transporter [Stellaceae bacterium]|nr:EamA family transporter [Stellaceae bacterium]